MTYDLKEYQGKRCIRTVIYNTSYQLCKGMKKWEEDRKQFGNYFKIEKNRTKPVVVMHWLEATIKQ